MIPAFKYHSYGNDFLVVSSSDLSEEYYSEFAKAICHPHQGIGGDGCVYIGKSIEGEFQLRIFNRDGSEAGMSGNGMRCGCAHLHHKGLVDQPEVYIHTVSGLKIYTLLEEKERRWRYRSQMGVPVFEASAIPFQAEQPNDEVMDYPLSVAGEIVPIVALSVGNPQCILFGEELPDEREFRRLGRALEVHSSFPERTNVAFAVVRDPHQLEIKIWERGVGPTHSSGTGCCGAAVAAIRVGKAQSPVTVQTETGSQLVEWESGKQVILTGYSELIANFTFYWRQDV